jgi:chromosomal replication initiator protein
VEDQDTTDITTVWARTLEVLEDRPDVTARQLGFVRLARPMAIIGETVFVAVPHEHTRAYLETSMRDQLISAMSAVLGQDVRFGITVDPELSSETLTGPTTHYEDMSDEDDEDDIPSPMPAPVVNTEPTRLNPRYVFDSFVIGASNRFAHAAAVAVAEAPAKAYNPLFIYGGSGLGKTHLLHAIGHYAHNLYPHVRVRYVNSEEFTNDVINSIGDKKQGAFQRRYRDVDVLLIDDIQFLQGKEQTMEEFFHPFNALHNANKQVVITSDLPPKQLNGFEDRLRSRFEWGLITDVQPPDLETRIAILGKKAAGERL